MISRKRLPTADALLTVYQPYDEYGESDDPSELAVKRSQACSMTAVVVGSETLLLGATTVAASKAGQSVGGWVLLASTRQRALWLMTSPEQCVRHPQTTYDVPA